MAFNNDVSKELMALAGHPSIWWDWCLPKDEKKEPVFADKVGRK